MTSKPKVCLIAAVAENGVIGRDDALPWRIKSEMQYFKNTTMGRPVVMGRKSFESLGKPLPGRTNIVITRNPDYQADHTLTVKDLSTALKIANDIATKNGVNEIFVGGGADIYSQTLPLADYLYLTEVHMNPEGDTKFPDFDRSVWAEIKREFHKALPNEDADYTITVLERKK